MVKVVAAGPRAWDVRRTVLAPACTQTDKPKAGPRRLVPRPSIPVHAVLTTRPVLVGTCVRACRCPHG